MNFLEQSKSSDRHERRLVADHVDCPVEILILLAKDVQPKVRCSVALHKNTPIEVLIELSKDSYDSVRRNVTCNENTPAHIIQELVYDKDLTVSEYASKALNERMFDFFTKE